MRSIVIIILVIGVLGVIAFQNIPSGDMPSNRQAPDSGFWPPSDNQVNAHVVEENRPVNIILFIADGMQLSNSIAISRYLHGNEGGMIWDSFPYRGYVATWDTDTYNRYASRKGVPLYSENSFDPILGYDPSRGGSIPFPLMEIPESNYIFSSLPTPGGGSDTMAFPATDSAAGATAIATGHKTSDGNISWKAGDPPDGALTTIAEILRSSLGKSIGIVTSVEFSHATPTPFVAHNTNRGNTGQTSHEIISEFKPEVVIGAGHPGWLGGYIQQADLNSLRGSDEYVFVERKSSVDGGESLATATEKAVDEQKKLFGLYGGSLGCFDQYEALDTPGTPGFDRNSENPTLAQATTSALSVLSMDPDGFFVMIEQGDLDWANHYRNYHWMIGAMYDLELAVTAAVDFVDRPDDRIDWSNTVILVTADHVTGGLRISHANPPEMGNLPTQSGTKYHYTFPDGEVRYETTVHTNELVMLYARGTGLDVIKSYEGSWYPGTRIIDNTQEFRIMCDIAGVEPD